MLLATSPLQYDVMGSEKLAPSIPQVVQDCAWGLILQHQTHLMISMFHIDFKGINLFCIYFKLHLLYQETETQETVD